MDGTTWTEVGRVTLELPERLLGPLAGMAAAAGDKELDEPFERLVAKVCNLEVVLDRKSAPDRLNVNVDERVSPYRTTHFIAHAKSP